MQKKAVYYKQPITSFKQLQKNCMRIAQDYRMGSSTKAQHMLNMFASYEQHLQGDKQVAAAVFTAIDLANKLQVHYAVDNVAEFAEDLHTAVHS
jgi:hypothetical protein